MKGKFVSTYYLALPVEGKKTKSSNKSYASKMSENVNVKEY